MIDCHIHLERGPYTIEWVNEFVKMAVERGIDEIYLLEHSHRFNEFIPMYETICKYSDYQREWFERKNNGKLSIKDYTNSDAHNPKDVGANIMELQNLLHI